VQNLLYIFEHPAPTKLLAPQRPCAGPATAITTREMAATNGNAAAVNEKALAVHHKLAAAAQHASFSKHDVVKHATNQGGLILQEEVSAAVGASTI
jgi:hypothetical protein